MLKKRNLRYVIKGPAHILYHSTLIALTASVALSLPCTADFIASRLMIFWTFICYEKMSLVSVVIALAMVLILFLYYMMLIILFNYSFNYIAKSWKDRKISSMANRAGLVRISANDFFARREIRRLKESNGISANISIIGSTGFWTFVEEKCDLQKVIKNCGAAKVMLLNSYGEWANIRAKNILDPDITLELLAEQIKKNIDLLKGLKAT